ncbi:MAG: NfeD family protein [Chloroflexota bacterium]
MTRTIAALFIIGFAIVLLTGGTLAQDEPRPSVAELEISGAITPVTAGYVDRAIGEAIERGDDAVLIRMNTPGGLSTAMDDIIDDILASEVPVIVYVAPEGARAASAGTYIAYAAHISAMAPVTNIGSATPIQIGTEETGEATASDRKAINDAVARIRELADLRGRNADWAEDAVRDAANVGASEAVELNVVDFVAGDTEEVLADADGREVLIAREMETVRTAGATVHPIEESFFERVLQIVVDPNVAFVLLSLGTLGLIFELSSPGTFVPGIAGALMMITGFFALGTLESNATGFILLALAFILFVMEVFIVSGGLLAAGGLIAFIFGGLLLSNSNNPDVLQVSRTVVFTVGILIALFFVFVVGAVARSFRSAPHSGDATLVGQRGTARTDLDPHGTVFVNGELWRAVVEGDSRIESGQAIEVTARNGMTLTVDRPRRADEAAGETDDTAGDTRDLTLDSQTTT